MPNVLNMSGAVFLQEVLLVCLYLVREDAGPLLCLSHLGMKPCDKI